ncbi:MAG: glycosyltransferase, partial [Patescibacteria group bacterium]
KTNFLNPNRKTILIIGGGSSLPKGTSLVKQLMESELDYNFVVVTGQNQSLKTSLINITKNDSRFYILGFIDYVPELIKRSALVVSKAGPAIIIETLMAKKPILIYHYIWEQELPNLQYVLENNLGYYQPNLKKIPQEINNILSKNPLLKLSKTPIDENSIFSICEFITD